MKVAVIGSGISGLAAAWLMRKHADVRVYEKNGYAGGHTNTIKVPGGPAVDTGFIVFNERNYPELTAMLHHLKVASQPSDTPGPRGLHAARRHGPRQTRACPG